MRRSAAVAPRTATEAALAEVWSGLLGVDRLSVDDDFFALGGHSLLAVRLMARVRQRFGRDLPLASLFQASTVARLAALLDREGAAPRRETLVSFAGALAPDPTPMPQASPAAGTPAPRTAAPPRALFCVHPAGGNVFCYLDLARALGQDPPLVGIQLPDALDPHDSLDLGDPLAPPAPAAAGAAPFTVESLAGHYLAAVRQAQPTGPYRLAGWSAGGAIAFEMACQAVTQGCEIELLALVDAPAPGALAAWGAASDDLDLLAWFLTDLAGLQGQTVAPPLAELRRLPAGERLPFLVDAARAAGFLPLEIDVAEVERRFADFRAVEAACRAYDPPPASYSGGALLLLAESSPLAATAAGAPGAADPTGGWDRLVTGRVDVEMAPGDHYSVVREPAVRDLAEYLRRRLGA